MNTSKTLSFIRSYWGIILAGVLLVGLLILIGIVMYRQWSSPAEGVTAAGIEEEARKLAPNFTLTTFDGETYSLEAMRGKVVVVNFWASWCKPCEQEAADLESAWRDYQPGGEVIFLGIAWTDTESASLDYLERFDITYPNGPDLRTRISQAFRTTGVPETYIIDKNGYLAYVKISPFLSLGEIKAAIDPLLTP